MQERSVTNTLIQLNPILDKQEFLLHDEYSMLDVAMAPLLWRLDYYDIKLGNQCKALLKYADKIFSRPLLKKHVTCRKSYEIYHLEMTSSTKPYLIRSIYDWCTDSILLLI